MFVCMCMFVGKESSSAVVIVNSKQRGDKDNFCDVSADGR
jgi:hypothetical protein